ncbi:MAG: hemolysin family protein [Phycisphaerales bacterium JB063]
MDDLISLILLIALPVLLVASAVFSGSETALFSLTPHEQARMKRDGSAASSAVIQLLRETAPLLVTLLISNMVINVLYFTLSTVLLERWSRSGAVGPGGAAGLALLALLGVILFGEVLPKQVAAQRASGWALFIALPLLGLHRIIAPIRVVTMTFAITPLSRLIAPPTPPAELSAEDLGAMLHLSERSGVIDQTEQDLLAHVIELGRLKVRDLMIPRVEIRAHDLNAPAADLTALARETRLRYLPIYDGGLDHVRGVVFSRDIMLNPPTTARQVRSLMRPVRFVPEIAPADVLLARLRDNAIVFAIAVDEYGGTAGLITLEDVVEHVVGEIPGAYEDGDEPSVETVGEGVYRVDADLPVHDWAQWFGHNRALAQAASGASTIGGLMFKLLGRLPEVGDTASVSNIRLTIDAMAGRRIEKLTITLTAHDALPSEEAGTPSAGGEAPR